MRYTPFIIALFTVISYSYISTSYYEKMPHMQDSCIQYFQARMYTQGYFYLDAPTDKTAFRHQFMIIKNNRWYSQYPPGWSAVLALGIMCGYPWMVAPFLAGICVLFIYGICIESRAGARAGVLACILFAASPFSIYLCSSFMNHCVCCAYQLGAVYCAIRALNKKYKSSALCSGMFVSMVVSTRLLNGVVMCVAISTYMLCHVFKKCNWKIVAFYIVGGILIAACLGLFNQQITGSWIRSPYQDTHHNMYRDHMKEWGKGVVSAQLQFTETYLTALLMTMFNWSMPWIYLAGAFILYPFVVKNTGKEKYLFLAIILLTLAAYFPYPRLVLFFGPRYFFEMTPFAYILLSIGFVKWLDMIRLKPAKILFTCGLLFLIGWNVYTFAGNKSQDDEYFSHMPQKIYKLKGFNSIGKSLQLEILQTAKIKDGVVYVTRPAVTWQRYGCVFYLNPIPVDTKNGWVYEWGE